MKTNNAKFEINDNGYKFWYNNFHSADGPAIEYDDGHKEWWINNKLHRTDGPAVEYANGNKEWWVSGIKYSEEEYNIVIKVLCFL